MQRCLCGALAFTANSLELLAMCIPPSNAQIIPGILHTTPGLGLKPPPYSLFGIIHNMVASAVAAIMRVVTKGLFR